MSDIISFLQSTVSIPMWLLLLLLLILLIQFINIYKKKGIIQVEKSKNLTDNQFTRSIITTVEKLSQENKLTSSIVTTAKKIQQSVAGKKQELEEKNKQGRENIMRLLFAAGGEGRLKQSIADELLISSSETNKLLEELISAKLVETRKTTFGETYSLTKAGSEYCVQQKLIKI